MDEDKIILVLGIIGTICLCLCFLLIMAQFVDNIVHHSDEFEREVPCYDKNDNLIEGTTCKEKYNCGWGWGTEKC